MSKPNSSPSAKQPFPFVSPMVYVGMISPQSSAMAVKIATLLRELGQSLNEFYLFYVPDTRKHPEDLQKQAEHAYHFQNWLGRHFGLTKEQIRLIPTSLGEEQAQATADLLTVYPKETLLFDADSGTTSFVASCLLHLPQQRVITLQADVRQLEMRSANTIHTLELANCGFEALLDLYQLEFECKPPATPKPYLTAWDQQHFPSLYKGFRLTKPERTFRFDAAFERQGRLYLVHERPPLAPEEPQHRREQQNKLLRNLQAYFEINQLRPVLALVYSTCFESPEHVQNATQQEERELLKARYQGSPSLVIIDSPETFRQLYQGSFPLQNLPKTDFEPYPNEAVKGVERPALLICAMGTDPSATLTALMTYEPLEALILYDKTSAEVLQVMQQFWEHWKAFQTPYIPVRAIGLDFWGEPYQMLFKAIREANAYHWVILELTPGTKIQALRLLSCYQRLYQTFSGLELWTMNYSLGRTQRLDAHLDALRPIDPAARKRLLSKDLVSPPLMLLGSVRGGGGLQRSEHFLTVPREHNSNKHQTSHFLRRTAHLAFTTEDETHPSLVWETPDGRVFLDQLGKLMYEHVAVSKERYDLAELLNGRLQINSFKRKVEIITDGKKEKTTQIQRVKLTFQRVQTQPTLELWVTHDKVIKRLLLNNANEVANRGYLFEWLVAAAIARHWKTKEVFVGVNFKGQKNLEADIDIVAQLSRTLICVECKSRNLKQIYNQRRPIDFEKTVNKIRNQAFQYFGRKAVPILAVPYASKEMRKWCEPEQRWILLMDLSDLYSAERMEKLLKHINTTFRQQ